MYLTCKEGDHVTLAGTDAIPGPVHVFEQASIDAVNAALAAGRPLLVRGEPGVGKTQLARAAAKSLGRVYVEQVVDMHTEPHGLMWHFDAVGRLAQAQLTGALKLGEEAVESRLAVPGFIHPRAVWWAFDWKGAKERAETLGLPLPHQRDGGLPAKGCVVLIDEIDKAEPDVPNGLLEALGAAQFTPDGHPTVRARGVPPLIVITTNQERALPDAFIRRCLVLSMALPVDDDELRAHLRQRGARHFESAGDAVLRLAADMLVADRRACREAQQRPLPGQAEYLDLVRAVLALDPGDPAAQCERLEDLRRYVLRKHEAPEP